METKPAGIVTKTGARYGSAVAASLFLLIFYWRGLDCWFYQDDFGWLHLGGATSVADFLSQIFAPKAHGNMRPWSENLFFYGLRALFGVNPLPFRLVVFATVIADLALLGDFMRKLTGSTLAAFGTQIFWLANATLAPALCWTCIYNQTQYLFFILLALYFFLKDRYLAQTVVFMLGLGSLETVVVYPLIVSLYTLLYDRAKLRRIVPLYLISIAYTALHFWIVPAAKSGPYAIHIDGRIFRTLGTYVEMVLGPERLAHFHATWPVWVVAVGTALMGVAVIVAALAAGRAAVFGLGWFLLLLAPALVLPDHIMDYLLTGPAIGLAIVLGAALASRWRSAAILVGAFYLAVSLPAAWDVTSWHYARSHTARDLVLKVVNYDRTHPGKTLLLTGMDTDQFSAGFADLPFELYGMHNVFLAPGADRNIHDAGGIARL
ncbi:MAG TPA: hypothetical protein VK776_26385, partial [Bryobacteraceae bacterium]|nr:hypothetical protein [Bryobacteraceae bacterium]